MTIQILLGLNTSWLLSDDRWITRLIDLGPLELITIASLGVESEHERP